MGGSGQISECMARELGDLVKLNSPVYRIDQTGDMVVVETVDKQTYKVCISEEEGSRLLLYSNTLQKYLEELVIQMRI